MRRRRKTQVVALALAVALALVAVATYQGWADRIQHRTDVRIVRTTSSCAQVGRLYGALSRLMATDPSFAPSEVAAMRKQRTDRLLAQGCKP